LTGCYEWQSSLLVGAGDGAPLAVAARNLVTAEGVWRYREADITPDEQTHLDELSERMDWLEQSFDKRWGHVIDREADSVAHMRQWSERGQH
jgi:hypothetical protein